MEHDKTEKNEQDKSWHNKKDEEPNEQEFCRLPDPKNGKMLPHLKYSSECSDFFIFFLHIFAMSLMIFACFDLQH